MWDGHEALKHEVVQTVSSEGFTFCLTYAEQGDGRKFFVVHVTSDEPLPTDAKRWMEGMGMVEFPSCPFLEKRSCFWKAEEFRPSSNPFERCQQVQLIHDAFKQICQKFPEALRKLLEASQTLAAIGLKFGVEP